MCREPTRIVIGSGPDPQVAAAVAKVPLLRMEIVKRSDDIKGFVVLPRRWVVERTFSWFGRVSPRTSRTCRDPGHLRYPRLHPACPQAACQGVGLQSMKAEIPNPGYADDGCAREDRDRGAPCGSAPPTPPGIRVTYHGGSIGLSGQRLALGGGRSNRNSGFAVLVGPPGVRTSARIPSVNRQRPQL